MKRFYRMVQADIRQGILSAYLKYMIVLIVSIVFTQNYYAKVENYIVQGKVAGKVRILDLLIYFFKGMKEYIPASNRPFEIPVDFLLLNMLLAFIIWNYPMKDMNGYGRSILARSDTRMSWWLSKCIWNVLSVLTYYAAIYIFSAFYMKWFMIGSYLMMYRTDFINPNGMHLGKALVVNVCIIIISILTGYLYFRRHDVLDKN